VEPDTTIDPVPLEMLFRLPELWQYTLAQAPVVEPGALAEPLGVAFEAALLLYIGESPFRFNTLSNRTFTVLFTWVLRLDIVRSAFTVALWHSAQPMFRPTPVDVMWPVWAFVAILLAAALLPPWQLEHSAFTDEFQLNDACEPSADVPFEWQ
jgi:hypothetical protein